ncbi:MAG: hypothetical protein AABW99_01395 [archaeon]
MKSEVVFEDPNFREGPVNARRGTIQLTEVAKEMRDEWCYFILKPFLGKLLLNNIKSSDNKPDINPGLSYKALKRLVGKNVEVFGAIKGADRLGAEMNSDMQAMKVQKIVLLE